MTLKDLGKVYGGKVRITCLAYYKKNGEYYSFRSYGDGPMEIKEVLEDEYISELPIIHIMIYDGFMWVDVRELV